MKKFFAFLAILGMLTYGVSNELFAQANEEMNTEASMDAEGETATEDSNSVVDETPVEIEDQEEAAVEEIPKAEGMQALHQEVKKLFIQGNPTFMTFVLLCLILGLALAIERIIYLNLASTNTDKLLKNVENALESDGIDGAKEVCRSTRGPVASIFYQGLSRFDEGVEMVEKSVVAYGSVQMGLLEKGLSWISLMISLAPMLGFMGTVIGMIDAFNSIEAAGDISPSLVAAGIKVALITTVSGLIVAIILQIFYNYLVSKVDSIVNKMEDASISLIDLLVKFNIKK